MRLRGSQTASLAAATTGILIVFLLVAALYQAVRAGEGEAEWEILVQPQIHRGYPYIYRIYGPPHQEAYLWTTVGHLNDAPARIVTDGRGEATLTVKLEWPGGDQHGYVNLTQTEEYGPPFLTYTPVVFSTAPPPPTPTAVPPPTKTPTPNADAGPDTHCYASLQVHRSNRDAAAHPAPAVAMVRRFFRRRAFPGSGEARVGRVSAVFSPRRGPRVGCGNGFGVSERC